MSNHGVAYAYVNVGIAPVTNNHGTVYGYANHGLFGTASRLAAVYGMCGPRLMGVAYALLNQLGQIAGAARTMEDLAPRHLEDGTTQRILE